MNDRRKKRRKKRKKRRKKSRRNNLIKVNYIFNKPLVYDQ